MPGLSRIPTDELTAIAGRCVGTDAERRAAVALRARLDTSGRPAELQALRVHPRFGLAHAAHATLAVVGSVVAVTAPAPGAALVLAAALLTLLDGLGYLHLLRRPLGTRASQNVEAREESDKPGVLVIAAAYDSPRESGALALATRLLRDPYLAMALSMLVILVCCALRLAEIDGTAVTVAQFLPTVLLILLLPALVDVELSGAGSDAAGAAAAATAVRMAGDLEGRLDHFAVWVVLTGANQPSALGMRAWLRRHRNELDRERTAVIAIGPVGDGAVHWSRREGAIAPQRSHGDLVRLSREVAEDAGDSDGARGYVAREVTNASRAMARRLPAITVATAGASPGGPEAIERLAGFVGELAGRLDAEVGPSLPDRD